MELISSRDIGLEKECDSLEQVVDVTEADIDIQSVLFLFVIRPKEVLFVRLRSRLVARDLDQFCHFNLQRKVSAGTRCGCQKQKEHIRYLIRLESVSLDDWVYLQRVGSSAKCLKRYFVIGARGSFTSSMIKLREPKCTFASYGLWNGERKFELVYK